MGYRVVPGPTGAFRAAVTPPKGHGGTENDSGGDRTVSRT